MNGFSVILVIISILLTAVGQLLLKKGANYKVVHRSISHSLRPYLNMYTIIGYGMLFMVTILSIYILGDIPLKVFFPLFISGNLITITILSHFFLHESITTLKIIGISFVISGIFIFSL